MFSCVGLRMDMLQMPSDIIISVRGFQRTAGAQLHLAVVSCRTQWLYILLPTLDHISFN